MKHPTAVFTLSGKRSYISVQLNLSDHLFWDRVFLRPMGWSFKRVCIVYKYNPKQAYIYLLLFIYLTSLFYFTWLFALILICPVTVPSDIPAGISMLRLARASSPKIDLAYRFAAMKPHSPDRAWHYKNKSIFNVIFYYIMANAMEN